MTICIAYNSSAHDYDTEDAGEGNLGGNTEEISISRDTGNPMSECLSHQAKETLLQKRTFS
jgi:hypothetical protein